MAKPRLFEIDWGDKTPTPTEIRALAMRTEFEDAALTGITREVLPEPPLTPEERDDFNIIAKRYEPEFDGCFWLDRLGLLDRRVARAMLEAEGKEKP
jgi:hypothetical protein